MIRFPIAALPAFAADQDDQLEQFLDRLGLADLQMLHLERRLQHPGTAVATQAMARRLADLYAGRLMESADDKARYADTLRRIRTLIGTHPGANTTALQVMLLQADYNRAEAHIGQWISDPDDTGARDEARKILNRITPSLVEYQAALKKRVEALLEATDDLQPGDELRRKEQELQRVQNVAGRAAYFAAWSSYYLALVTGAAPASDHYLQARDIFRRVLDLEDGVSDDTQAEWLRLESIWRSRSLIGLGLCEAACGDMDACDRCFALLESSSVPLQIKDQAPYWYVRALLGRGDLQRAVSYAQRRVAQFHERATQGQVSFCVALVRRGFGAQGTTPTSEQRKLGQLGLNGLARLGQLGVIDKLMDKYAIRAGSNAGFVLLWAQGQQQFAAAEKSKSKADFETALGTLKSALRDPDAKSLLGPASRCRYTLAWCHYRLEAFEAAATEFAQAASGLKAAGDSLAVESAWMAFVAYRRLADKQPRFLAATSDALKRIQRDFPAHPYARRAEYELTRLLARTDPAEMIRRLEQVPPDADHYLSARYDLCSLLHQNWREKREDPREGAVRLRALRAAVDTYLKAAASDSDSVRKLKCCLLVAEAALHSVKPEDQVAEQYLDKAAPLLRGLAADNSSVVEYHYRQLELAGRRGDGASRRQEAAWLAEHAAGTAFELSALMVLANQLDRELRNAPAGRAKSLRPEAYATFQRLAARLGGSPAELTRSKNAQIAHSKLAEHAYQLGHYAEASDALDKLLAAFPRDRRYLRRAALARQAAGQDGRALESWRRLLAGLDKGSDEWYEAKFNQLKCLGRIDKDRAAKVFRQFQLLYPELGGAPWREQFLELAKSW